MLRQIQTNKHTPGRRRGAEYGDLVGGDGFEIAVAVENLEVETGSGGPNIEGGEETAPRPFGPTGGAEIVMDIVRTNAGDDRGGEVTDRIGCRSVTDTFRQSGGSGGEEAEQQVIGFGLRRIGPGGSCGE